MASEPHKQACQTHTPAVTCMRGSLRAEPSQWMGGRKTQVQVGGDCSAQPHPSHLHRHNKVYRRTRLQAHTVAVDRVNHARVEDSVVSLVN